MNLTQYQIALLMSSTSNTMHGWSSLSHFWSYSTAKQSKSRPRAVTSECLGCCLMSHIKIGHSIITNEASITTIKAHYLCNYISSKLVSYEPYSHAATFTPPSSASARRGRWEGKFRWTSSNCLGKGLSAFGLREYITSSGLRLLSYLN